MEEENKEGGGEGGWSNKAWKRKTKNGENRCKQKREEREGKRRGKTEVKKMREREKVGSARFDGPGLLKSGKKVGSANKKKRKKKKECLFKRSNPGPLKKQYCGNMHKIINGGRYSKTAWCKYCCSQKNLLKIPSL